ncbi:glycoside hydrolase family 10 protein [Bombardia bombarda]|uniref:Beta-xylanase n=1 Tax=Bombardia bombarda TaxID=252184 RepID=A0AA40C1X3_9PEZI|nr:glycoside hydrolase family 10 protein [Bombardia bombarda]
MLSFKTLFLSALAAAGLVAVGDADGLNARSVAGATKYLGTAIKIKVMADSDANTLATNFDDFGAITPENEMKFPALEPARGVFNYTAADIIVAQAQASGQILRCHNLVWHANNPPWLLKGGFDNATLISILRNHITNVVGHYKGKCYAWDVVNEALNDDGSLRTNTSIWYSTIGPAYIPIAFAAAAEADPAAKLYYNDYSCEKNNAKAKAVRNLIGTIRAYGAPIHGVGLQAHLTTGQVANSSVLASNLQAFADLDVEVAYTELDLSTPADNPNLAQQAADYATVVSACKLVPKCVGVSLWGFTDKYTWINNSLPLPWSADYTQKPAYTSIADTWCAGDHWDQCGGLLFKGCPGCASPYSCTFVNPWASFCL